MLVLLNDDFPCTDIYEKSDGITVGVFVDCIVGCIVGRIVGLIVGALVGVLLGPLVGLREGVLVLCALGLEVVGTLEGAAEGTNTPDNNTFPIHILCPVHP